MKIDYSIKKLGRFDLIRPYTPLPEELISINKKGPFEDYSIDPTNQNEDKIFEILPNFSITLPQSLLECTLLNNVKNSIGILNLKKNWDNYGSEGYSKETLINAIEFLVGYTKWIWEEQTYCIPIPNIFPGSNGSIDLYWKTQTYDFIINIPKSPNTIARFYGDDKSKIQISGSFPIDKKQMGIFMELLNLD